MYRMTFPLPPCYVYKNGCNKNDKKKIQTSVTASKFYFLHFALLRVINNFFFTIAGPYIHHDQNCLPFVSCVHRFVRVVPALALSLRYPIESSCRTSWQCVAAWQIKCKNCKYILQQIKYYTYTIHCAMQNDKHVFQSDTKCFPPRYQMQCAQ